MAVVNIGRKVEFADLEKALLEAAKEIGWNVEFEDKYKTEYQLRFCEKN